MDISTATPAEIDTRLNELAWQYLSLAAEHERANKMYKQARGEWLTALETVNRKIKDNLAERYALEAEYDRRPWTRAFVVPGGHVHADYYCHTLFATTQRYLAAPVSGFDEAQVVEAAGERACTHCYPSAPVDVLKRKTTLFTPDEEQAERERAKKAAEKVKKDAAKAAKAITNPDGTPLKIDGWELRTERTAQTEYVDLASYVQACEAGYEWTGRYAQAKSDAETILAALAHKRGTSAGEQREVLAAKVAKKAKGYF